MRSRDILILAFASLFLAGFDSQKTEVLIKVCVEQGHSTDSCRCAMDLQEEMFGPGFMEASYLQVAGDVTAYEKKLYELVAKNPNAMQDIGASEARIKEQCFPQ